MTPTNRFQDQELLERLLLGKLSTAEAERLEAEFSDDDRLAALAESLSDSDEMLRYLRQSRQTQLNPSSERIILHLLRNLQAVLPAAALTETKDPDAAGARSDGDFATGAAVPAAVLPERFEYYRPIGVLGEGGMGTVYMAEDTRLGRQVALKTLKAVLAANPRAHQRFLREARTAAKLGHDHIVPIYYVGESNGIPFLAMPLLKGESLGALLRRTGGALPVPQALRIARETLSALAAAHDAGLIHRDIKPPNIWIEAPGGRVKVLDFGLAKPAETDLQMEQDDQLTAQGAIVGTPAYMAPEQAASRAVGPRADLFSLGCVLYEMLTGTRAFTGKGPIAILHKLANHTPPAPDTINPTCPAKLSALVMKLLEKDPDARPRSAEAVIAALADVENSPAVGPRPHDANLPVDPHVTTPSLPQTAAGPVSLRAVRARFTGSGSRVKIGVLAVVLLAGLGGVMFAGQIFRIATNQGELVVSIDDPAVEIKIVQAGVVVQDKTTKREFTLRAGPGEIEVLEKDGVKLTTRQFAMTRGGKTTVSVTLSELADVRTAKRSATHTGTGTGTSRSLPSLDSAAAAAAAAADRSAARWLLSRGGQQRVTINDGGQDRTIEAVDQLPAGAFTLKTAQLMGDSGVTDAELIRFKSCQNLTELTLFGAPNLSDAGLANFRQCKNLTKLALAGQMWNVTDSGLANFQDCKNLTNLYLHGVHQLSDVGLAYFSGCKSLKDLALIGCSHVADKGLAYFGDCHQLESLILDNAVKVTDDGLAHFRDCKQFTRLHLRNLPQVTDHGLAMFQACKSLAELSLNNLPRVTDAGLATFQDCKNLAQLWLEAMPGITDSGLGRFSNSTSLAFLHLLRTPGITDSGLGRFGSCQSLTRLDLYELPAITDAGLAPFEQDKDLTALVCESVALSDASLPVLAALPKLRDVRLVDTRISLHGFEQLRSIQRNCQITWMEPNRSIAEKVLELGGQIEIGAPGQAASRPAKAAAGLPAEFFQVRRVSLAGVTKPLERLPELLSKLSSVSFDRLERLDLSRAEKFDYAVLAHIHGLRELSLADAGLNDDALALFPKLPALERLVLDGNDIRGLGVSSLKEQPALVDVSLACPSLVDLSARNIASLGRLKRLTLSGSSLTDAGIRQLAGMKSLEFLDLSGTKTTPAGIADLQKHLPGCRLIAPVR